MSLTWPLHDNYTNNQGTIIEIGSDNYDCSVLTNYQ
jgi:hypothetical protein